jgi:hypothetical protein
LRVLPGDFCGAPTEIVKLADRWSDLPDPIRTAILALLASAGQ